MQCNVEKAPLGFWKPRGIATVTVHCTKYNQRKHKQDIIATSRINKAIKLVVANERGSDPP